MRGAKEAESTDEDRCSIADFTLQIERERETEVNEQSPNVIQNHQHAFIVPSRRVGTRAGEACGDHRPFAGPWAGTCRAEGRPRLQPKEKKGPKKAERSQYMTWNQRLNSKNEPKRSQ
jgi:hypothetical protein